MPVPNYGQFHQWGRVMMTIRHFATGCALAAISLSAAAGTSGPFMGMNSLSGASKATVYVENFDNAPRGELPPLGLDLPAVTVKYAGAVASGVENSEAEHMTMCGNARAHLALEPVQTGAPYDIAIGLKHPAAELFFGLCADPGTTEDTSVEFFTADGTSVQKNVFVAGDEFAQFVNYTGSAPVANIVIHGGGQVYVDNIWMQVTE